MFGAYNGPRVTDTSTSDASRSIFGLPTLDTYANETEIRRYWRGPRLRLLAENIAAFNRVGADDFVERVGLPVIDARGKSVAEIANAIAGKPPT